MSHEPIDRETLIEMLLVGELMLQHGHFVALSDHLAFIRGCLQQDLGMAQLIHAREEGISENFLCQ